VASIVQTMLSMEVVVFLLFDAYKPFDIAVASCYSVCPRARLLLHKCPLIFDSQPVIVMS